MADLLAACSGSPSPFSCLSETVIEQMLPTAGNSLVVGVRVNAAFIALATTMAMVALVIKLLQGRREWWLFRLRHTSRGTLVLPNTTLWFICGIIVFGIVAEAYNFELEATYRRHRHAVQFYRIQGWVWTTLWTTIWSLAFGMANAGYLDAVRRRHRVLPAWQLNAFFGMTCIAFWAVVPTLFIMNAIVFEQATDLVIQLSERFAAAQAAWDGQTVPTLDQATLLLLQNLQTKLTVDLKTSTQRAVLPLSIFACLATVTFFTTATYYAWTLRRMLHDMVPKDAPKVPPVKTSVRDKMAQDLRMSYRLLLFATFSFALFGIAYSVLAGWPLVSFHYISTDPTGIELQFSLGLWFFSFLGTPSTAVMLYKTVVARWVQRNGPAQAIRLRTDSTRRLRYPKQEQEMVQGVKVDQTVRVEWQKAPPPDIDDDQFYEKLRDSVLDPEDAALYSAQAAMSPQFVAF